MENILHKRTKELRTHYNKGAEEFAQRYSLSHVSIFHLENGRTLKPHKSSLVNIMCVFDDHIEYLVHGNNEMLANGSKEISLRGQQSFNQSKEEPYLKLKTLNQMLENQVERLWQMINHFTDVNKVNFQRLMAG